MKTKIAIYIGNNPTLSLALQTAAFCKDFEWLAGDRNVQYEYQPILHLDRKTKKISFNSREETPCDYDANTEFGKLLNWLDHKDPQVEFDKLTQELTKKDQEITQLRDEVEELEKRIKELEPYGFPEGYDWHNPDNLTPSEVGVSDGWRLLTSSERREGATRPACPSIQGWIDGKWDNSSWSGDSARRSYRVKWPLPSSQESPTSLPDSSADGFPQPVLSEQERNAIIKKWLKDTLEAMK